ncbi:AI-2E family transporter [Flavobacteriaceae bacterium]|nr:AI-2E family transporter [Flavobacteriaceae bacterium]
MNTYNSKNISNGILRALAIISGICILLFFLFKISDVLIYIALAGVISLIGRPIIRFFTTRLKFKNTLAVVFTMLLLLGLLVSLISMFIPLIKSQGENLSILNYKELESNFKYLSYEISSYLDAHNIDLFQTLKNSNILSKLKISAIPEMLNSILGMVGSISIGLFSVLFISFFFLKDSKLFEDGILLFFSDNKESRLKKSFEKIKDLLSRYFVGLVFQILILFIIYTITLLIFGIKNAVVIAFLCSLLNLIPYIGPLIGGVLMLILSMSSNLGLDFQTVILPKTTYILIGYAIAQIIDNFISQPLIFSNSVKSHPLEIFLIIIIGGLLFGVIGMIIAVPTYTALKVILKEFLSDNKIVKKLTKGI